MERSAWKGLLICMEGEYTEQVHAERLIKMLERENPCSLCPGAPNFQGSAVVLLPEVVWPQSKTHPCDVCKRFVNAKKECPCYAFGHREAIKRTWFTLEAKGYLE